MREMFIKNGIFCTSRLIDNLNSPIGKLLEKIAKKNNVNFFHIRENVRLRENDCTKKIILCNKNSGTKMKTCFGYRIFDNNFGYPKKEMEYNVFYITPDKGKKVEIALNLQKTSKYVYWSNCLVIGVNPNTLEYLGGDYFKDDKNIYHDGKMIEGINISKANVVKENDNIIVDDKYIFVGENKRQKLCNDFRGLGYNLYFNNGEIFNVYNHHSTIIEGIDINNLRLVDYNKLKHYLSEYILKDYGPDYQELMPYILTDGYNFYLEKYSHANETTNQSIYKLVKIFDINTLNVEFIDSYLLRIGNELYDIEREVENISEKFTNIDIPTLERHGEYYLNSFFSFIFRTNNVVHVFKDKNGMLVYSGKETYLKPLGFFHKIIIKFLGKYF